MTSRPDNLIKLDDLIFAYLRFKEWMDYDLERSAYCAKEIMVFQTLFGTSYVEPPQTIINASHSELLQVMNERMSLIDDLINAIYSEGDDGRYEAVLSELNKTTFISKTHYFKTLHQAISETADSVTQINSLNQSIDTEAIEDHFNSGDALFEEIRYFILSEHPEIKHMSFSIQAAYSLGLPRHAPEPIDHGPSFLN